MVDGVRGRPGRRPARPTVAAIAVGGQQHGMVVLDAAGAVIRPAKLWNDTESAPDAGWLLQQLPDGAAAWAAACGSVPVAAFTVTKLSWLHRCEPEHWSRVARVLLPHDWLTGQLYRRVRDRPGRRLGHRLLVAGGGASTAATCWRSSTPSGTGPTAVPEVLGPLDGRPARWRRARSSAPGTGDNMAAALGHGPRPGDVARLARHLGHRVRGQRHARPPTRPARWPASPTPPAASCPLVCTLNATKVTDAVARLLGRRPRRARTRWRCGEHAGRRRASSLLPYLDGERTPDRPDGDRRRWPGCARTSAASRWPAPPSRAWCAGCSTGSTRSAAVAETGAGRLVLVGGGARSAAYRQVLADLSGRAVTVPAELEHVAAGALRAGRRGPPPAPARAGERGVGPLGRHGRRTGPGGVGRGRRARRLRRPPRRRSLTVPTRPTRPVAAEPRPLGDFGAPWRHEVAQRFGSCGRAPS